MIPVIVRTRDSDGNVRFSASSAGSPMDSFQTTVTDTNTGIAVRPGTLVNNDDKGWTATASATQTVTWPDGAAAINLSDGTTFFVGYNADGDATITTTGTDLQATAVQDSISTVMTYTDPPGTSEITQWSSTLDAIEATVQEGSNAADQIDIGITFSVSDGLTVGASYIPQDTIDSSFTPAGAFNPRTVTASQTATISGDWGEFSLSYDTKNSAGGHSQNSHWEVGLAAVTQGPGYGTGFMVGSIGKDDSANAATVMAVYSMGGTGLSIAYNNFTPVTLGTLPAPAAANTNIDGTTATLTMILGF